MQENGCLVHPEEKVKKRNETVKILSKGAPRKSNMQFFFGEGPPPNSGHGEGGNFLEDGQITNRASQPGGEARTSEAGKYPAAQPGQNYVPPQSLQ